MTDPTIVKLTNVRLSFPALFKPKKGPEESSKEAYSATFLMDKKANAKDIALINKTIAELVKTGLKGKHPGATKVCIHDGAEKPDLDGFGDSVMFTAARSDKRPGVVNRDLTPLTEADDKPYAGCYVNATIRLWAQDNKFGKRINAQLRNVQFVKDGEPFGERVAPPEEEFEAIDEEAGVV